MIKRIEEWLKGDPRRRVEVRWSAGVLAFEYRLIDSTTVMCVEPGAEPRAWLDLYEMHVGKTPEPAFPTVP